MAREMAQGLRSVAVLPEDIGSVPSIHMDANNCLQPQFQRSIYLLLAFEGTGHTCGRQTYIQAKYPYTLNK